MGPINPFDDAVLAARYESWYAGPGRVADVAEKALLGRLLRGFAGARTVLDVGCGTGHFTRWFATQGLAACGLDVAAPMLGEARRLGGPEVLVGDALALPFPDRAFDLTAMITALEFVPDPARALAEALRVARRGLLLGVLNRVSLLARRHRRSGRMPWLAARFFSPAELAALVRAAAGPRIGSIRWRTTLWPLWPVLQAPLPWGGFIGMAVHLAQEDDA